MEFATLAVFLLVVTALCVGERRVRAHLARRRGRGFRRGRSPGLASPAYEIARAMNLLSRRSGSHRDQTGGGAVRIHQLGRWLTVIGPLLALATIPFGRDCLLVPSTSGALVALMALASTLFGDQLAGEAASGAAGESLVLEGARRGALILASLGLILVAAVMIPGTADLSAIVEAQASLLAWFAWRQPLGLALMFTLCVVAQGRGLPAGGSLVAEAVTVRRAESGAGYALRSLSGSLVRVFFAALLVSLYLGGWSPGVSLPAGPWWTLLSVVTFVLKTLFVLYAISWVGRRVPEFRPDQVQRLGWKLVLPCAAVNAVLTAAGITLFGWVT